MHENESESEVAQSCPTLSDPMDCSLPGSSIHGIFQARVLEWGAKASLVMLNSLSFCLSVKPLISPSNLDESLAGKSIPSCRFEPFITLLPHSLLVCRVSAYNLLLALWEFPYVLFVAFPLFNIFSLIFVSLIIVCFYVLFLLELILYGTLCASWTWVSFLPMIGKFSVITSWNILSGSFSGPCSVTVTICDVPKVSQTVFISFFFILVCGGFISIFGKTNTIL